MRSRPRVFRAELPFSRTSRGCSAIMARREEKKETNGEDKQREMALDRPWKQMRGKLGGSNGGWGEESCARWSLREAWRSLSWIVPSSMAGESPTDGPRTLLTRYSTTALPFHSSSLIYDSLPPCELRRDTPSNTIQNGPPAPLHRPDLRGDHLCPFAGGALRDAVKL